ncbi:MAG: hypothetical protein ABR875_03115 [Minisyncoccia bacterium]
MLEDGHQKDFKNMDEFSPLPSENTPPLIPVEPKKKFNLKIWIPIIVVVLLIVGYVAIAENHGWWPMNQLIPTATPIYSPPCCKTNPTPFPTTDNWKTYTNNQYGFDLKYPAEWNQSGDKLVGENGESMLLISVIKTTSSNIQDWFDNEFKSRNSNEKPTYSSIVIAGFPALHYEDPTVIFKSGTGVGNCISDNVFIKNGNLYDLQEGATACSYYPEVVFSQILSTFKFTK